MSSHLHFRRRASNKLYHSKVRRREEGQGEDHIFALNNSIKRVKSASSAVNNNRNFQRVKHELATWWDDFSFADWLSPWEKSIRDIEREFGTGIGTYFRLLKFLFGVNALTSTVIVLFVAMPNILGRFLDDNMPIEAAAANNSSSTTDYNDTDQTTPHLFMDVLTGEGGPILCLYFNLRSFNRDFCL